MHVVLGALDELNGAVSECEQRVVLADAHVVTRGEVGAALANDDLTGLDGLAAIDLDAEALGVGVAPVARGTETLLMCHDGTCLTFSGANYSALGSEVIFTFVRY